MRPAARKLNLLAASSLVALIFLCLAWELWWAPLRPGGSWLALKALPLLAPLFGVLHGQRYTHQWTSLLALTYLTEGLPQPSTAWKDGLPSLKSLWQAYCSSAQSSTLVSPRHHPARLLYSPPFSVGQAIAPGTDSPP